MKKVYLLLFLIVILQSCVNSGQRTRLVEKDLPMENFVRTFINQNPNYALNDITKEETSKLFSKVMLDSLKTTNLLYGVPMKLEDMNKNGTHTMIHLGTWIEPTNWEYRGILNEVNVDVISSVSDSLITILENDKYYRIYGKYIERLNLSAAQVLFGKRISVYTPNVSIEKDDIWDDKVNVDLGILYFEIDSIIPFNGRDKEKIAYQYR